MYAHVPIIVRLTYKRNHDAGNATSESKSIISKTQGVIINAI